MTTDDFPGDEIASAYLDGEATPDEVALVESSPALLTRVEELRLIARAVARPVTPPADEQREAAIRAALTPATEPVGPATRPSSLGRDPAQAAPGWARQARARRARRWLPALGAAAAVVAVLAIGSAVIRGDGSNDDLTAASLTTNDDSGGGQGGGEAEEGAPSAAPADGADALASAGFDADLGSFDSLEDLVAAVDERSFEEQLTEADSNATSTTAATGSGASTADEFRSSVPCFGAVVDRDDDLGPFVYAAPATYRDVPVIVLVFDLTAAGSRLYVVDSGSCNELNRLDR